MGCSQPLSSLPLTQCHNERQTYNPEMPRGTAQPDVIWHQQRTMTKGMCIQEYRVYLCFHLGFISPDLIDLLLKCLFLSKSLLATFLMKKEKGF